MLTLYPHHLPIPDPVDDGACKDALKKQSLTEAAGEQPPGKGTENRQIGEHPLHGPPLHVLFDLATADHDLFPHLQREFGCFDLYIWQFVNGKPKKNAWKTVKEIPSKTTQSDAMSRDLIERGFKFAGSTICYAFMQATGMVNDHTVDCFRYHEVS